MWYSLNPLFCEWPGCELEPFAGKFSFFFSLSIPDFLLLSHISSLRLSSGHLGRVLTLSMQPATPCSACTRWLWIWVSGLLLCWELWLGAYSVGFFVFCLSSRLCWPLRFQNSPQTHRRECVLLFGNFSSFTTPCPGQVSVPNSFASPFVFFILSYLLLKRMGCRSGCLVSSTSIQKVFCRSCSELKWSFDEFVGEKVVSPSYSSAILGLPPDDYFYLHSKNLLLVSVLFLSFVLWALLPFLLFAGYYSLSYFYDNKVILKDATHSWHL